MELTRFLTSEWRRWSVLSVIRTACNCYLRQQVHRIICFHQLLQVITFIVAIWALSFSCCLIHLVKSQIKRLCTGYLKRTKVLARWQITYFFSALQAHKNISLYRHSVWVKKMLYYSNIYLPFRCEKAEICLLQTVRGTSFWIEAGWSYEVRWEMIQWHYKVLLTSSF